MSKQILYPNPTAGKSFKVFKDPREKDASLKIEDLFSVAGKVALVTGGSRGIGRMISAGLVSNGAKVYICSRKVQVCEETCAELNKDYAAKGGVAVSLPGDLSSIEGVVAVATALQARESELHILVNNAGATWGAPLEEYPDEAWQKIMDLNVRHVFNLTVKCLPMLRKASAIAKTPSSVINIASVDGVRATQTNGPAAAYAYSVSKAAVIHLTKSLCRGLSPDNITVNTIAPGLFPSQMTKFALAHDSAASAAEEANPLKRIGRTADMAGTVMWLASTAGSWINGNTIVVDGGQILHSSM